MKNILKVAGLQTDLFWENSDKNIQLFSQLINKLDTTVDLILLPEMFTSGFTMNASLVAETMSGKTVDWMLKTAKAKQAAICGTIVIKENNNFYNRFVFVHPNGKIDSYNKRHSFTLAGENEVYTCGHERSIINYCGWKICPQICYDLRFPVWSRNTENYDLLIYLANWPVTRIKAWDTLLKARAIENMSYTIGVNRVGKDDNNYAYSGNSLIVDYLGGELAKIKDYSSGILIANLDYNKQQQIREKLGFLKDSDTFTIHKK